MDEDEYVTKVSAPPNWGGRLMIALCVALSGIGILDLCVGWMTLLGMTSGIGLLCCACGFAWLTWEAYYAP